jgi:hypothetical protein
MTNHDTWKTTDRDGEDAEYQKRRIDDLWEKRLSDTKGSEFLAHLQSFQKWTDDETRDWLTNGEGLYALVDKWDADRQLDFLEGL